MSREIADSTENAIDLRTSTRPGDLISQHDLIEVNGNSLTSLNALTLADCVSNTRNFARGLIDGCLVDQAMRERGYYAHGKGTLDVQAREFREEIIDARWEQWWSGHRNELEHVTCAWITLDPSRDSTPQMLAGALASHPSAAVVSARCEGRRGGFLECEVTDLAAGFRPLRDAPVGSITSLALPETAIGIVVDRAGSVPDKDTKARFGQEVFEDWLAEERAYANVRWLWAER